MDYFYILSYASQFKLNQHHLQEGNEQPAVCFYGHTLEVNFIVLLFPKRRPTEPGEEKNSQLI